MVGLSNFRVTICFNRSDRWRPLSWLSFRSVGCRQVFYFPSTCVLFSCPPCPPPSAVVEVLPLNLDVAACSERKSRVVNEDRFVAHAACSPTLFRFLPHFLLNGKVGPTLPRAKQPSHANVHGGRDGRARRSIRGGQHIIPRAPHLCTVCAA